MLLFYACVVFFLSIEAYRISAEMLLKLKNSNQCIHFCWNGSYAFLLVRTRSWRTFKCPSTTTSVAFAYYRFHFFCKLNLNVLYNMFQVIICIAICIICAKLNTFPMVYTYSQTASDLKAPVNLICYVSLCFKLSYICFFLGTYQF